MNSQYSAVPMPEGEPKLPHGDSGGSSMGMAGLDSASAERWADDAAHSLRTPGAYEWWCFDGLDQAGNGVMVILFNGLPFYTPYQSQVARWHRRRLGKSRLEVPWPEVQAGHYPAAYLAAYQGGRRVAQFLNLYPPGSCEGSADGPEVRVGPNRMTLRADGSFGIVARGYPFECRAGGPTARRDQTLSATLSFVPTFSGVQHVRPFRPEGPDGARHRWVLASPHGRITGRVQHLERQENLALLDLAVNLPAYHDHNYGHGALGLGVRRLAWGRAVGDHWTAAWQRTLLRGAAQVRTDGVLLFEVGSDPLVLDGPTMHAEQMRLTRWLIRYAGRVAIHGSDAKGNTVELLLEHGPVIETSPFHARLVTSAALTVAGRRQYLGRGVTNVLQLHRLRWPVLSDVVLKAVLPVAADDPLWRQ